ncbi:MAG TPA: proton-conducting transporter membrane subunit [Kineosporiaceae bacterium]
MPDRVLLAEATVVVPAVFACALWWLPHRWTAAVARLGAALTAASALATAGLALGHPARPRVGDWIALDAAGGLLLAVIGFVGFVAVLASPAHLAVSASLLVGERRRHQAYYLVLFAFWATLLAVPVAGNLGAAWLLVEATTAASALLVGFNGRPRALEAGWKYLILTSLGLGVALLGVTMLAAGVPGGGLAALTWRALPRYAGDASTATCAYVLLVAGLAAKIGWAPVHNWLPDAHSEAPAPVSALLSAALLPGVLLVAWRCAQGVAPVVGPGVARGVLIGFGLTSMGTCVPFLSRPLAWKRLLAYSSLEHMGVIALGVGFGTPLALAGVAVHVVGHALAKSLGFVAVTPLLAHEPQAAVRAVGGIGRTRPGLGVTLGLSLGALAGLPPSPLFVSELLIIAGGFAAGLPWVAGAAALALALAFLGMIRALLETAAGEAPHRSVTRRLPGLRGVQALAVGCVPALLALAGAAPWLPATDIVRALAKGVS